MIGSEELRQVVAKHLEPGLPGKPACTCGWEGNGAESHADHLGDVIVAAVTEMPAPARQQSA